MLEWSATRKFPVVAVGPRVPGATIEVAYLGAGTPFAPLLVETGGAELVAAELWKRRVAAGDTALVGE